MLITHAAHFVSTQLIRTLNQHNFNYLIAVDDFQHRPARSPTLRVQGNLPYDTLPDWLNEHHEELEFIFHFDHGEATTVDDELFEQLWKLGSNQQIPLLFRATPARKAWVEQQQSQPFFWAGLTYADAFGPGDATSTGDAWVPRAFQQLQSTEKDVEDLARQRAMVYSKDIAAFAYHLVHHRTRTGFYALDTEKMYTFPQVVAWVEQALKGQSDQPAVPSSPPSASWFRINFNQPTFSAEAGVYDYVQNHLME